VPAAPAEFAAIVIGSGFGGSVAALRLQEEAVAKGEQPVLLLERGMPYPPGSFPRSPREFGRGVWDPSSSRFGLLEMWHFQHADVLVSSGLGGGSLIYANVLKRITREALAAAGWPLSYDALERGYERVEEVIPREELPRSYYEAADGSPGTVPKAARFTKAAEGAGFDAEPAELAVTFRTSEGEPARPGEPFEMSTLHDRMRHTCTLVGECDVGCNEGAKNTLDYNYLAAFKNNGGVIRTCCEAIAIERNGDAYEVRYLQHLQARARVEARARLEGREDGEDLLDEGGERESARVRAPVVVLAAGVLGSSRLLLSSRPGLPSLSPALGRRFSSNGDLLLFARECRDEQGRQLDLEQSRGPVITSIASGAPGREGVWLEDGGGPNFAEWGWQLPEIGPDLLRTLWSRRRELVRELRRGGGPSRIGGLLAGALGSARSSSAMMVLLAMGIDRPGGRIRLDEDGLKLDWNPRDSAEHFERAEAGLADIAAGLGGELWPKSARLRRAFRGLTVHPLGGCPMGRTDREGVVNSTGEVFGCPGLFVCDGSVLPGPVGVNPSLTIAAVAEHIATAARERMG
jgi:cholesterol oxidase